MSSGASGTSGRSLAPWAKALIAFAVLAIYVFSQPFFERGTVADTRAASIPAWHLVETGSLDLTEYQETNPYFVKSRDGIWTNRSPGIVGFAIVAYGATKPFTNGFEMWPGTAMAVLTSWIAVMFVAAAAERVKPGLWLFAVVLFGLGTATWGPAANQLNSHGPAQMAVAIGIWFLVSGRDLLSGVSIAVAVVIRPPVVILGVGLAVAKAIWDRSVRPLAAIGLPSVIAGLAYLAYGRFVFESWSPTAAYEAVGGFWGVESWLLNTLSALGSLSFGVFVWSSWLIVGIVVMLYNSRSFSRPLWLLLLVGLAYVIVHSSLEIASGGLPYNYRYPLEAVTMVAPFVVLALPLALTTRFGRIAFVVSASLSLVLQAMWSLTGRCGVFPDNPGEYICFLIG